jgi:hypothetical protein
MNAKEVFNGLLTTRLYPRGYDGDYKDTAALRSARLSAVAERFKWAGEVEDGYSCPRSFLAVEQEQEEAVYGQFLKVWKTLNRKRSSALALEASR